VFYAIRRSLIYERSPDKLLRNLLAGLTVGVIALPLSMALAIASGVPPQHGLYTAIVAGIVIALGGGSKVNISGPTAAFVVVLLPIVHHYGIGGLLVAGFMAGAILVAMSLARLGRLIEIVPYPVTIGFTAGIGVVIATLQIKDFLGLDLDTVQGSYFHKVSTIVSALPSITPSEMLISGMTLAILILWPRLKTAIPGHLVAIFVGSLAAWGLHLANPDFSVATLASRFQYQIDGVTGNGIPPMLPELQWPWKLPGPDGAPLGLSFDLIRQLLPAAFTIAMLGAIESLLCAVVADGLSGKRHNPNDELFGQGLGNMLAPLFGGIPATAAIARTAANIRAGGSSPLSSVVHSLFILAAMLLLAPLLAYIPMASMAALLLVVAWNMSEAGHFLRILRIAPRNDIWVMLTCFSLTVLFDMTIAVAVGMGLAAVLFIGRSIDLAETRSLRPEHDNLADVPPGVTIYDINGPLFFGSAQKALKNLLDIAPDTRTVVLDMSEVTMLDMSAIVAVESIKSKLDSNGTRLIICGLQSRMILKLKRAGLRKQRDKLSFARNLKQACRICDVTGKSA
jgi:sulfate permease, SulP family